MDGDPDDIEVGQQDALDVLQKRKLEVLARQQQGLKARRVKKFEFDFQAHEFGALFVYRGWGS